MPESTSPSGDPMGDTLDPAVGSPTPPSAEHPANVLGASAIVLGVVGIFFVWTFGVANLLAVGLGIGSLVRSRRRGQTGGVGIVAIALGIVGLGVTAFVIARYVLSSV